MSERSKLQKSLKRHTVQLEKLIKERDELDAVDWQISRLDQGLVPARSVALELIMKESMRLVTKIARQRWAIERLTRQLG